MVKNLFEAACLQVLVRLCEHFVSASCGLEDCELTAYCLLGLIPSLEVLPLRV